MKGMKNNCNVTALNRFNSIATSLESKSSFQRLTLQLTLSKRNEIARLQMTKIASFLDKGNWYKYWTLRIYNKENKNCLFIVMTAQLSFGLSFMQR